MGNFVQIFRPLTTLVFLINLLTACAEGPQGGLASGTSELISTTPESSTDSDQASDNGAAAAEPQPPEPKPMLLTFDDICTQSGPVIQCIQGLYEPANSNPAPLILVNPNGSFCLNPRSAFVDFGDVLGSIDEATLANGFNNLGECNPPQ